jgi:hypothetical protein
MKKRAKGKKEKERKRSPLFCNKIGENNKQGKK